MQNSPILRGTPSLSLYNRSPVIAATRAKRREFRFPNANLRRLYEPFSCPRSDQRVSSYQRTAQLRVRRLSTITEKTPERVLATRYLAPSHLQDEFQAAKESRVVTGTRFWPEQSTAPYRATLVRTAHGVALTLTDAEEKKLLMGCRYSGGRDDANVCRKIEWQMLTVITDLTEKRHIAGFRNVYLDSVSLAAASHF